MVCIACIKSLLSDRILELLLLLPMEDVRLRPNDVVKGESLVTLLDNVEGEKILLLSSCLLLLLSSSFVILLFVFLLFLAPLFDAGVCDFPKNRKRPFLLLVVVADCLILGVQGDATGALE